MTYGFARGAAIDSTGLAYVALLLAGGGFHGAGLKPSQAREQVSPTTVNIQIITDGDDDDFVDYDDDALNQYGHRRRDGS